MAEPVKLVGCERRSMRLLESSCAKLWLSCQERKPAPWEGRAQCADCRVGAARAGREQPPAVLGDELRHVCPRCGNGSDRIVGGLFCISCYNRHREALIGRNAKGTRPRLTDQLHTERLAVAAGGTVRTISVESVTSMVEAIVVATKRHRQPGTIVFSRAPLTLVRADGQLELAL